MLVLLALISRVFGHFCSPDRLFHPCFHRVGLFYQNCKRFSSKHRLCKYWRSLWKWASNVCGARLRLCSPQRGSSIFWHPPMLLLAAVRRWPWQLRQSILWAGWWRRDLWLVQKEGTLGLCVHARPLLCPDHYQLHLAYRVHNACRLDWLLHRNEKIVKHDHDHFHCLILQHGFLVAPRQCKPFRTALQFLPRFGKFDRFQLDLVQVNREYHCGNYVVQCVVPHHWSVPVFGHSHFLPNFRRRMQ